MVSHLKQNPNMKILLYSDHEWTEDSFPFFIEHISKTKGVTVESIDRRPAPKNVPDFKPDPRPERANNGFLYPDWGWFYKEMTEPAESEYAVVLWHEDGKTGRRLQRGASRRYNGVYDSYTRDHSFNAVIFAGSDDVDSRTRSHHELYPDMTLFERIFLHEVSHGVARVNDEIDRTHFFDYKLHNIPAAYLMYDLTKWKTQRRIINTLNRVIAKQRTLLGIEKWHPPLQDMDTVTQTFGVRNPDWYPQTKHHVGIDYGVPVGTRLFAPKDCTISKSSTHNILGHWCEIETTFRGETVWVRYMHLQFRPEVGDYKRGEIFGLTGNTGFSTNPHLHWDIRRAKLIRKANENNWRDIFINPNTVL